MIVTVSQVVCAMGVVWLLWKVAQLYSNSKVFDNLPGPPPDSLLTGELPLKLSVAA